MFSLSFATKHLNRCEGVPFSFQIACLKALTAPSTLETLPPMQSLHKKLFGQL
jgi:hypothetical protein